MWIVSLSLCRHSALPVLGLVQCSGCAGAPVTLGLNACQEYRAGDLIQLLGSAAELCRAYTPSRAVSSNPANGKSFHLLWSTWEFYLSSTVVLQAVEEPLP